MVTRTPEASGRFPFIDAAKAIAIYLVIIGHLVPGDSMIFRFVFSFHMPAFFFFSGYCTKRKEEKYSRMIFRKAKTLLLPYVIFSLFGFLLMLILPSWRVEASLKDYLVRYLYIAQPYALGSLWFLVCLFWASIMLSTILRLWSGDKAWTLLFVALGFAVSYVLLYKAISANHFGRLPWKVDSMIGAMPFMIVGYYLKEQKFFGKIPIPVLVGSVVICPFLIWLVGVKLNGYVNICDCVFDNPIYYYVAAFIGIFWLVSLGKLLENTRIIVWIGQRTMPIFIIHGLILWIAVYLYGLIIHERIDYLPDGVIVFAIGLIVLAACLPFAWGYAKVVQKLKINTT